MSKITKTIETWKPVADYEGLYEVSDHGNVRRVPSNKTNYYVPRRGSYILKPGYIGKGYPAVVLSKNGNRKTTYVHRLVAVAFIPNPKNLPQVNHINGIITDYSIENLEWVTAEENIQHVYKTGLKKGHDGIGKSTITTADVDNIKSLYSGGMKQSEIGKRYGVDQTTISKIVNGHITPCHAQ